VASFLTNHCVVLLRSEDLAGKSCSLQGHNSEAGGSQLLLRHRVQATIFSDESLCGVVHGPGKLA
jgi:hypothetical protein